MFRPLRTGLLSLFLLLITLPVFSQLLVDWETLAKVPFEKKFSTELDANFWFPAFPDDILALEGQRILMQGYLIVMDVEADFLVLSANPFASCFFCGNAGPESVVELRVRKKGKGLRTDEYVWVSGRLKLNARDVNQMNFILEDADISTDRPGS